MAARAWRGVAVAAVVLLAACRPPAPLAGKFPRVGIPEAQGDALTGERVRWGGSIVSTKLEKASSCVEVVSKPLGRQARPAASDRTDGRFIACTPEFLDPKIYTEGRDVTVVGTIRDTIVGKVGDYEYRYPRLDAETVYLWPERPEPSPVVYTTGFGWYPFYYHPWGFYPWGFHRSHRHFGHRW